MPINISTLSKYIVPMRRIGLSVASTGALASLAAIPLTANHAKVISDESRLGSPDVVDTQEYFRDKPGVQVITSKEQLDASAVPFLKKLLTGNSAFNYGAPTKYIGTPGDGYIIAPPMANKYMLGREYGQHVNDTVSPVSALQKIMRNEAVVNRQAWESSPEQGLGSRSVREASIARGNEIRGIEVGSLLASLASGATAAFMLPNILSKIKRI